MGLWGGHKQVMPRLWGASPAPKTRGVRPQSRWVKALAGHLEQEGYVPCSSTSLIILGLV